eukprot:2308372-Pleurochrysis_carterae.AAC.3
MSLSKATHFMHRRLHAGATVLRALPNLTADAPSSLAHGSLSGCEACIEANATRLPHTSVYYKPSYAGRLTHADIAGPFLRSQRYAGVTNTRSFWWTTTLASSPSTSCVTRVGRLPQSANF